LLAVDFLLDENDNLNLIEINSCPNLNSQSDEHKMFMDQLVAAMIENINGAQHNFFEEL